MLGLNKKIVIFAQENLCRNTGGSITCTTNMANLLSGNGYDVKCVYYSNTDGTCEKLNDTVELINLYDKNNYTSFSKASNLFIEKYKPDLIIFFFPHLYVQAALNKKFENIPRILMFHSRPDWYFADDATLEESLKRLYANTTSVILFDSYYNLLPEFIQQNKVITIPNAINQHKIDKDLDVEYKKIVFFSRIDPYKGIDFLLKSFKLVVNQYPDWHLDLYGDIEPAEYKQKLNTFINRLNLNNNVSFKGIVNNASTALTKYDFAVFPSYFEGFPIGLLEMQSMGLGCVGLSGCSGVNELIIDNYNGFLSDKNIMHFAQKIKILIQNSHLRKTFCKNAIIEAKKYNSDVVNEKWLVLIQNIINNTNNVKKYTKSKNNHLFTITKIKRMNPLKKRKNWYKYVLSITRSCDRVYTIITIFGFKIKIKRKNHA